MKKQILLFMLLVPFSVYAQLKVQNDGGVIIAETSNSANTKLLVAPSTSLIYGSNIGVYGHMLQDTPVLSSLFALSVGVLGTTGNGSSGYNYSIWGNLSGSNNGAGIFGTTHGTRSIDGKYAAYLWGETYVDGKLTATEIYTPSDIRLKKNVSSIDDGSPNSALASILSMNVLKYNYIESERSDIDKRMNEEIFGTDIVEYKKEDSESKLHFGLSAQELQDLYPNLVEEGQNGYLAVNYTELVPVLIRSIQELQAELDELKEASPTRRASEYTTTIANQTSDNQNVLYQNTPNPFKEQTSIRFKLADNAQEASICIFDMTGKIIKKFPISSGMESVSVGGYELGEGMFLYSLIVNGQVIDTKRMVISK